MIALEPLEVPLDNTYRERADKFMRERGTHLLACEWVWDCLRHHKPERWDEVIDDLRMIGSSTAKWFS